jgi:hypothetical protein
MTRQAGASALTGLLVIAIVACGRGHDTGRLTRFERARSGILDVELLSSRDGLHHGKDAFVIEFRSAAGGALVDVGTVRGDATMPMPGMPMLGSLDVSRTNVAGRYRASSDLSMAGTWRMTLEWNGPTGRGSVTFSGRVQ